MSEPLLTARYTALAQPEDGAGNDARRAKRVHRLENASPSRPSPAPPPSSYIKPTNTNDTKATLASRRKSSLRDSKGPLGPRPLDMSPSKRVTSDSSNLYSPNSVRPTLPNATSEPFLGLSGRRNTASNFNFDSAMSTSGSHIGARKAFLRQAAESNDSSKTTPVDTRFPSGNSRFDVRNRHSVFEGASRSQNNFFEQSTPSVSLTPGASPTRARNPPIRATQVASGNSLNAPLSTNLAVRTRRQSQFPPAPVANPDARQPRKSLGPGVLMTNGRHKPLMDDSYQPRYTPSDDLTGELSDRSSSGTQDKQQPTLPSFMAPTANTKRYIKTQSLQPGPRQTGRTSATQRLDSETNMHGRTKSPARPKVQRLSSTPTSTLAIQGGGLGARTISPTDARKLKRASRSQEPPPVPQRSHTPEFSSALGPDPTSPIPRQKSATPSSSRATPDVGQRTSSARPLSSRSSYCSARSPSATAPIRPTIQTGAFKTPNQKQRNVHSSAGGEDEIVPPVPAIPKAFESPKDQPEQPFFSNLKSGLDNVETTSSKTKLTGDNGMFHDANTGVAQGRHKRGFTTGSRTDAGQVNASQHGSRQGSQQMRLPPLNLLPLGDPTSAKIASLYQQPRTGASGKSTPPPKRGSARTPTTPMTASKATFSQYEHQFPYDLSSFPPIRSSTSYDNADAKGSSTNNDSEDGSSGANVPESPAIADSRLSPFVSSSLPKASDGTKTLHSENTNLKEDPRASRLIGRRSRAASKGPKDTSATPATEVEQQPAPNSLRRRLSMGWRRSSSKASHQREGEPQTQTQSSDMPPPKIPASVLIQESLRFSPGLSSQTPKLPELEPRKRSVGSIAPEDKSSQPNINGSGPNSSQNTPAPQPQALQPSKSTSSLLSPVHKIINARSSNKNLQTQESKFDRDDVAAEEEMRKLAYKRKDFESTMKEMDELKKRASPKDRISPGQAARMSSLNIYERGEVIDYTEVYFCGQKTAKKFVGDLAQQSSNFGFDDERGDYNIVMGDHLAFRYEVIDVLGKGSFGQVVRCIDHKTGKLVAIKIIRNKKRFHQQALVEVGILQKLREWDAQGTHSTISFTQSFYFRGHLCISTELLGMNLYEFIKAHDFRGFSLKLIRRFTKQMLGSLVLLQDHKVIHCDLKPENILLSHPLHSEIKTIDFGSSCLESEKVYTYIQSRFYRAPEVILGANYGMPIDMWSLGCILAELLTGYPIFPGENEQEQLACIMEVFGPPEKHLTEKSTRKKLFFDSMGKPRITVSSKGKRRRPSSKTLQQALKCDDEAFLDFLTKCLRWDPDKRMKPNEATKHEFVTGAKKLTKSRASMAPSLVSSPAKRVAQSQTPSKARPLPEPPATSYKDGIPVRQDGLGAPSSSPIKSLGAGRRHSAMNNLQPTAGMKKVSQSAATNSALPRVTNRSASGKPDLASAAAIASLQAKR